MNRELYIEVFGPMRATDQYKRSVLPRARKTRALLAVMAMEAPTSLSRATLCALLWSGREQEQARASLRQSLRELRLATINLGEDFIYSRGDYIIIRHEFIVVDYVRFFEGESAASSDMAMFRGQFLEEFDGISKNLDYWIDNKRKKVYKTISKNITESMHTKISPDEAASAAEKLILIDKYQESLWIALMEAHRSQGKWIEGSSAYHRCVTTFASAEKGKPSQAIQSLNLQIESMLSSLDAATQSKSAKLATEDLLERKDKIRLGVMPFRTLNPEWRGLALGLSEEITSGLSRFRWLSCVSSFSLANITNPTDKQSPEWSALALDFLLEGSLFNSIDKMRVSVQLINMRKGREVIWAQKFDRALTDILSMQEDISAQTVAQVDPELLMHESERISKIELVNPTSYLALMQAISAICRLDKIEFFAAESLLAKAVELDPRHAAAHAWWAYWHLLLVGQGWAADAQAATMRCWNLTQRALSLDVADARALTIAGHVQAYLYHNIEAAHVLHAQALTANPNLPIAWAFSGLAYIYSGQVEEGRRRIERARSLSPFDPHSFFFEAGLMLSHLLQGEYDAVQNIGRKAIHLNPSFSSAYKIYLSALGHLGSDDEAARIRRDLLRLEPDFNVEIARMRSPLIRSEDRDHYVLGLRLAGCAV